MVRICKNLRFLQHKPIKLENEIFIINCFLYLKYCEFMFCVVYK